MNSKRLIFILTILLGSCICGNFGLLYGQSAETSSEDTIRLSRYQVSKTIPESTEDLDKIYSADLRTPENLKESTEYDETENRYKVGVKLGDSYLNAPFLMTPEEYSKWSMQRSMQSFFRSKNVEEFENNGTNKFDFTDMKFDLGPAEKIFGPGGVQIRTNGSASIKFGVNRN